MNNLYLPIHSISYTKMNMDSRLVITRERDYHNLANKISKASRIKIFLEFSPYQTSLTANIIYLWMTSKLLTFKISNWIIAHVWKFLRCHEVFYSWTATLQPTLRVALPPNLEQSKYYSSLILFMSNSFLRINSIQKS